MGRVGFWMLVLPIVFSVNHCFAQSPSTFSNTDIIDAISNMLADIDACSYRARMNSKFFGSDSIEVRDFSVHVRRNPDNTLYGYDWEISEHMEGYTFTFMILPSSWYRIHSGTHGLYYQSLLEPFEPGSFFWTMRDYLILEEVFAPFRDVPAVELSVRDSADCYYITRQMNDQAIRELVVQKNTYQVLSSTSTITDEKFDMIQTIAVDFSYESGIALADTAFAPDYYVSKGYQLNIVEQEVVPKQDTPARAEDYQEMLLSYPLVSEGGDSIRLTDFEDGYMLLDFWYASCIPCLRAMPEVEQLARDYSDAALQVFGINCFDMDIRVSLTTKLREKNIEMPLLFGSRNLTKALGINSFPSYILITPDREVEFIDGGVEGVRGMLSGVFGQ